MFVLSAAGHVDHGKSTLLSLLTGMPTDRLQEEKKRGMTMDLGFVWLDSPHGRVGIIDVPGHQRFVKSMVCGTFGGDAFLFVVAADDGWMPQSEEHLQILRVLGFQRGIVVISKADLVDAARLAEVEGLVAQKFTDAGLDIRRYAFSKNSPEQLAAVREGIHSLVATFSTISPHRPMRYWVDRVFSPQGAGVVATGTLRDGGVSVGDAISVWPSAKTAQVRSLQVHEQSVEQATPTTRAALQLSQIEVYDIARGTLLTSAPPFLTSKVDARIHFFGAPPKKGLHLKCYVGTLEVGCQLLPSGQGMARLKFDEKIPLRFGDRLLLRLSGEERTVGGGVVLDPKARARSRMTVGETWKDLPPTLENFIRQENLLSDLLNAQDLEACSVFSAEEIRSQLTTTFEKFGRHYIDREKARLGLMAIESVLQRSGKPVPLDEMRKIASDCRRPLLEALLQLGLEKKKWILGHGGYALPSAGVSPDEKKLLDILQRDPRPYSFTELQGLGVPKDIPYQLAKRQLIIRLGADYVMDRKRYQEHSQKVKDWIVSHGGQGATSDLKVVMDNSSRKHALLILEQMDSDRLTYLKDGVRKLMKREG